MTLTYAELCAGYGGLGLAIEEVMGAELKWYSEFDAAPSKIMILITWLRQLLCPHDSCSWKTEQITGTLTKTTGGCDHCGKRISPWCPKCGR